MSSSTNLGTSARQAHSADKSRTCCSEGTFDQFTSPRIAYLIRQEEPEETFRKRLITTRCLGKNFLTFRNCLATESNTLVGIKNGTLPYKTYLSIPELEKRTFDSAHTTVDHVNCDGTEVFIAMFLSKSFHLFLFLGDHFRKRIFQRLQIELLLRK